MVHRSTAGSTMHEKLPKPWRQEAHPGLSEGHWHPSKGCREVHFSDCNKWAQSFLLHTVFSVLKKEGGMHFSFTAQLGPL